MSDTSRADTSLDDLIEDVCVRFEDAWRAGQRPSLDEYLGEAPAGGRAALLPELLKLDVYYRQRGGDRPTPDDYRQCVPDDRPSLWAVFPNSMAGRRGTLDRDAPGGDTGEAAGGIIGGRYKLVEKVGEGGMGEVWAAEQTQPVRRQVALKLIKAGMDSKAVLWRFGAESQALSLMDHPNIARVFDGGRTEDGRPFFAMEFIHGAAVTKYCDDARLTILERVELFVPVCQAVQHAHQKGVIHRDLKPSNILVCRQDGRPVPKVIDFGLAKVLHQPLTEHTLSTAPGAILGTPLYMSPEQVEFNNPDVDTRSDVYSLGVDLYELLTGTTPLERQRFKDGSWPEVLRLIKDEEPPRPSNRLSGCETLPNVAARRNLEPARLPRLVRGELDWIVMKCLEKDRSRRYETASALALDLQRYLAGEPVQAAPPSAAYRVRKFVRKNRGPAAAAAVVFLALLAGIVGTTIGLARAQRALVKAEQKEAEAEAVTAFLEHNIIAAGRPAGQEGGLGRDVKLIEAVRNAVPYVKANFTNQPLIEARLRMTLGLSFEYLGDCAAAESQYEVARRLRGAHLGLDHPDTLKSMAWLAGAYAGLDRHPEAAGLREDVLQRLKSTLGPHAPETLEAMSQLSQSYLVLGRTNDALALCQDLLLLRQATRGPHHADTLRSMSDLAHAHHALRQHPKALELRTEVLALQRANLAPEHPSILHSMNNLATSYSETGRHAEALDLREKTLQLRKAQLGPDHPDTLWSVWATAESLVHLRRGDEAAAVIDECLRLAAGKADNRRLIQAAKILQLRRLVAQTGPAADFRTWAETWETPNPKDPGSLYWTACAWALTSAVQAKAPATDAAGRAAADADTAMAWLAKAVAAGYDNRANLESDPDLAELRTRGDFPRLLASLRVRATAAPVGPAK